jgi:predicted nucleic acid-binding protein
VDLLDLNVWFALLVPEHPFHPRARAYWEEASDPFLVRVTALGLLRLPQAPTRSPPHPSPSAFAPFRGGKAKAPTPSG